MTTTATTGAPLAPVELLQHLLRFDTTNPPGNEAACVGYIDQLLTGAGFATAVLARDSARPNLVARLPGRGAAPPLLLHGHVDVVTTAGQTWRHPPFEGRLVDGCVWGRGAVDMKGGLAMMLGALLRAKAEGLTPAGDVVLAVVSDEEAGGEFGARYLVEEHGALFAGARYAVGEVGGFTFAVAGRRFYPIGVAEKRRCYLRATLRGPGGHGSLPVRGGAMARLGRLLVRLDARRLPVHVTPVARQMIEAMAAALPAPSGLVLRQLLRPALTDRVLDVLGPRGQVFDPLLHNTVNATIVRSGEMINVVPNEVSVDLDGRLLPGYGPTDLLAEVRRAAGGEAQEVVWEVLRSDPHAAPGAPDMGLFPTLTRILREQDAGATPVPLLLSGSTDGRHFARLGIQTYGFTPMRLPADLHFARLFHGPDERIPVEALAFGTECLYRLLERFGDGEAS
jgi:acetylornithine deacetylase/succinyl-diaminopimelate desuccinylase-like protein